MPSDSVTPEQREAALREAGWFEESHSWHWCSPDGERMFDNSDTAYRVMRAERGEK